MSEQAHHGPSVQAQDGTDHTNGRQHAFTPPTPRSSMDEPDRPSISKLKPIDTSSSKAVLDSTMLTPPQTPEAAYDDQVNGVVSENDSLTISDKEQGVLEDWYAQPIESHLTMIAPLSVQQDDSIGSGLWSKVYCASRPSSVAMSKSKSPIVAVKRAEGAEAVDILRHEARILSYIQSQRGAEDFVIECLAYSVDSQSHPLVESLILEHAPVSLDQWARNCQAENCPLLRTQRFHAISRDLITGLDFLHAADVVHGDIKPANILLRAFCDFGPSKPIYIDFSASRITTVAATAEASEQAAATYEYMAPELFKLSTPDFRSDVYALGVTLIQACTGKSPYAGHSRAQKMYMASQGQPLDFAAIDVKAVKRMEEDDLTTIVGNAVKKDPNDRITASQWKLLQTQRS